ncbi:hypothetical protein BDZ89DRAFT_1148461 [Hymenopellis radicata]|nr:hypothetical protein BDZ89DRAFT_1148461 [Hymenopellis radicata]
MEWELNKRYLDGFALVLQEHLYNTYPALYHNARRASTRVPTWIYSIDTMDMDDRIEGWTKMNAKEEMDIDEDILSFLNATMKGSCTPLAKHGSRGAQHFGLDRT